MSFALERVGPRSLARIGIIALFALLAALIVAPTALAGVDDYPAQWRNVPQDSVLDSWGYYNRECTSFAAWRLHSRNGFEMPWAIGNAVSWGTWAASHGYAVNRTPAVGALAWWNSGYGHVAWVESVNANGTVTVEEYNSNVHGGYDESTFVTSLPTGGYIHFKDLGSSPPPFGGVDTSICTRLDRLNAGQYLMSGQYLVSQNGLAVLIMQGDGNLVLYGWGGVLWKTDTTGSGAVRAVMQSDGNFVLYRADNSPVWDSKTTGQGASRVVLQDDGNFVAYTDSGTAKWSSGTGGHGVLTPMNTDHFAVNTVMHQDQYIRSADKRFMLMLQGDGNLVLYGAGGHALWSSGTTGKGATWAVMQSDGNFVLYTAGNAAVWSTKTPGSGANTAILQNDGNFVLYAGASGARWASNTGGRTSDESPPWTALAGADSSWHRTSVALGLNASDSGGAGLSGGAARTEYKLDSGSWTTGTSCTVSAPADNSGDGEHTVAYRSVDAAGNTEAAKSVTVRIDTAAPAGSFALAGGAATTSAATVSVDSAVSDAHGPLTMRLSADGGATWTAWSAYAATQAVTLGPGDGTKTVLAQYQDAAGNVLALSDDIELVTTTPDTTGPVTHAKAASGRVGRAIALRYMATDDQSSLVWNVRIVIKNARGRTVKSFTTGALGYRAAGAWYAFKWKPKAKGTYRYRVYAKDAAGNAQSRVGSAKIGVR